MALDQKTTAPSLFQQMCGFVRLQKQKNKPIGEPTPDQLHNDLLIADNLHRAEVSSLDVSAVVKLAERDTGRCLAVYHDALRAVERQDSRAHAA